MKKILLSIAALVVAVSTSFSQEANVGLKLGIGWSQWYGDDIDNLASMDANIEKLLNGQESSVDNMFFFGKNAENEYIAINGAIDTRMSFHAGFQINSEINDYFWLKHEFLFATKGFSYTGTKVALTETVNGADTTITIEETDGVELRYRSYHVDILPVSLAAHYEGLQLFVGPYVSVMLASNWIEKQDAIVTTPGVEDFTYVSKVNSIEPVVSERSLGILDYGFVAGFEYELPFGLNAGIRYMQGFASVLETPDGEARTNAFNKDLRVSLGYTFGKD